MRWSDYCGVVVLAGLLGATHSAERFDAELCSNSTAACTSPPNVTTPPAAMTLQISNVTMVTVGSACVSYVWSLQCLAVSCDATPDEYYATCATELELTCSNLSLVCANITSCPYLVLIRANCSDSSGSEGTSTSATPPTDDPFGSLGVQGLISVVVGGVVLVAIVTLFLMCCVCWCRRKSSLQVDFQPDMMVGMTTMNPLAHEISEDVPVPKPRRPLSMEQSIDGVVAFSNVTVDDRDLIQSYLLTDDDIRELTSSLGGAVLPSSSLTTLETLKDGVFHTTCRSLFKKTYSDGSTFSKEGVVKIVKGFSSRSDLLGYLQELSPSRTFIHPNVMAIVGVVLDGEDRLPRIVRGFSPKGDVRAYVRSMRRSVAIGDGMPMNLSEPELVRLCYEVSMAMQYLSNSNFVHGNLKARNCLLDSALNVKVADFCPVRDTMETGYLVSSPARWLAPEVFSSRTFSLRSDVWSFGVLCWEVFNLGRVPYHGMDLIDLPVLLKKGQRLERPLLSPQIMYGLMSYCWEWDPARRPSCHVVGQKMADLYRSYTSS